MDRLKRQVEVGRQFLVVELETGTAMVSDGRGDFRRPGGAGSAQFAIVDLAVLVEQFDREAPDREVFTLTEVARMSDEKAPTVHSWVKAGVIVPSIRDRDGTRGRAMLFGRLDAFVACVVAAMKRRGGLPLAKLHGVGVALKVEGESPEHRSANLANQGTQPE